MGGPVSKWSTATHVDVVILTALRLEFDAVLEVHAGADPGSTWELLTGPGGLPIAFRSFRAENEQVLRVAVAVSPDMGATAAVTTLLPLVERFKPRCLAMCGVCAGRRGKTRLGDVVAAERLFYHDSGKQLPSEVQQDLTTYKLRDDWKAALEGLDPVARFRDTDWFRHRPLTTEWREHRALIALRNDVPIPWNAVEPGLPAEAWKRTVDALRERGLLAASGRAVTDKGRQLADNLLFEYQAALPDLSPTGTFHPFQLHVAPMGSGARVIEDEAIWGFVSQAMRKTLALEMEGAALGELAHRLRDRRLDVLVMKGVMDFADHGRDDHFKEFAARAAAECLLWFLRKVLVTTAASRVEGGARGDQENRSPGRSGSQPAHKHTILFLAANPIGTPRVALERESRAIQKELEGSGYRDCFAFETRFAARPLDLLRELRKLKPTVVHFSGHGSQEGLYFEAADGTPQLVTTAALAETFGAAGDTVQLAVLSACYSEPQAQALLAHIECVVGVSGSIDDDTARAFAVGFYGGLGERASIAAAYQQGRAAIGLEGLPDSDLLHLRVRDGVDAGRLVLVDDL